MIILGIDPGTATTGFGVIDTPKTKNSRPRTIDFGCIKTSKDLTAGERLKILSRELQKLIKIHQPKLLAVEKLFFFKNLKTAMPVSEARGVILLTAAKNKIPVREFTPLQVKMTVSGYGRAEKKQVQKMIKVLLNLEEAPKADDAADALGVAICCFLQQKTKLS